jgi:hypothetical protein
MDIDPTLFNLLQEMNGRLGGIEAEVKSNNSYIQAVSANVKEVRTDLGSHKEDLDAHGGKSIVRLVATSGGVAGLLAALHSIYEKLK